MIEVRLHGALGRDFGSVWNLEVASPAEAINAIATMKRGFRAAVMKLDQMGMVFRIRNGKEDLGEEHLSITMKDTVVDVIPILRGASAGVRFVIGAVLIVAGVLVLGTPAAGASPYLISAGVSLVLGSIAEMLTPKVKREDYKAGAKSWTISGPLNETDQGQVIPVIYGEVLTGGLPISAGLSTAEVAPNETADADVSIGGIADQAFNFGGAVDGKVVEIRYSASPFNMNEPNTYAWSISGFALATSKQIINQTTATLTIRLTYTLAVDNSYKDTGTVSVSATGYEVAGNQPPSQVSASDSLTVSVSLDTYEPHWGEFGS